MKYIFSILLITCFITFSSNDALAQRRYDDDEDDEKSLIVDRLFIGTYINSPIIQSNTNSSLFGIGLQPFVGYKFNSILAAGLAVKFNYLYSWSQSGNTSLTDFSSTIFTRATIAERIILQVEGGMFSDQSFISAFEKQRTNFPVAYAGVGYSWGQSEIMLSYELTGNLQRYQIPIEYKFGLLYHF